MVPTPTTAPAQRFYTKRDCLRGIVWNTGLLFGGIALSAFLPHISGGAFPAPTVYLLGSVIDYYRVRRGDKMPVPNPRPSKPWEMKVLFGFVVVLAGSIVWLESAHLLPALLQPTSVLNFVAALYLHFLSVAVLLQMSRTVLTEKRRCQVAAQAVLVSSSNLVPVVAEEVPMPHMEPRHWWTETGTRDEVQQKIGRDQ